MPLFRNIFFIGIIISGLTACTGSQSADSAEPAAAAVVAVPSAAAVQLEPTPSPTPTPLSPTVTPSPTPTPIPSLADILLAEVRHSQGADDAPVTFIEFSDFK